ncbi:uncharacterized protein [Equus caballus]|uniref:uncharacterized protein n=1 Tax=Equus caballus TaxID=9796 RepID=UPI0038B4190C
MQLGLGSRALRSRCVGPGGQCVRRRGLSTAQAAELPRAAPGTGTGTQWLSPSCTLEGDVPELGSFQNRSFRWQQNMGEAPGTGTGTQWLSPSCTLEGDVPELGSFQNRSFRWQQNMGEASSRLPAPTSPKVGFSGGIL